MKKNLQIIVFLLSAILSGQVGIGTTSPDSSAVLEVSSSNKKGGILLPQVSLSGADDVLTVPTAAIGLMVYNLSTAGNGNNQVVADNIYLWNGTRWNNLSDMQEFKKILLPPVFFAQQTNGQTFTGTDLTQLNNGTGVVVTFQQSSVTVNNGAHITLNSNSEFIINSPGQYELSSFINYSPRVAAATEFTILDFRVQRSTNAGASWTTIATTREAFGRRTGEYYRSVIMPPSIIQNLNVGDRLRLMIVRPDNYGTAHGSVATPSINSGLGVIYPKTVKILKLN